MIQNSSTLSYSKPSKNSNDYLSTYAIFSYSLSVDNLVDKILLFLLFFACGKLTFYFSQRINAYFKPFSISVKKIINLFSTSYSLFVDKNYVNVSYPQITYLSQKNNFFVDVFISFAYNRIAIFHN